VLECGERLVCFQCGGREIDMVVTRTKRLARGGAAVLRYDMLTHRLVSLALDRLDYLITSTRLRVLDKIWGPEPLTSADESRERERDRLRKAFPKVDNDGEHR
jgi:hypothetical protein